MCRVGFSSVARLVYDFEGVFGMVGVVGMGMMGWKSLD